MSASDKPYPEDGLFTTMIYYNGRMRTNEYYRGMVHIWDKCHLNKLSLVGIAAKVVSLDCYGTFQYYWKHWDQPFEGNLTLLKSDDDVYDMAIAGVECGEIDLYVKRLISEDINVDTTEEERPRHTIVVIEQLDDSEEELVTIVSNKYKGKEKFRESRLAFEYNVDFSEERADFFSSTSGMHGTSFDDNPYEGEFGANVDANFGCANTIGDSQATKAPTVGVGEGRDDRTWEDGQINPNIDGEGEGRDSIIEEGQSSRAQHFEEGEISNVAPVVEEVFVDPDYNLEEDDDDLIQGVEHARRGRPRSEAPHVPNSGIDPTQSLNVEENSLEYGDSDALRSESDSENENRPRYPEFNAQREMADPVFRIGLLFNDYKEFKQACRNHGIANRHQPWFKPNTPKKVGALCKGMINKIEKCPWRVYASRQNRKDENNLTMQVKSGYFIHECCKVNNNFHMTYKWLGMKYLENFRSDPDWKVQAMVDDVSRVLTLDVKRMTAYRAKSFALNIVYGDERSQYDHIFRYKAEIERSNPGSTVMGRWKEGRFMGLYICLNALKSVFKACCRKLISLDGCWLKGVYEGQLLSAVGIDPNDCIFPIAYAMVETKSGETWSWFLALLAEDLDIHDSSQWTFMSDRQKGLIQAFENLFPEADHRFCVRHMYTNFRNKFKGKELKDLLWNAARAPYIEKHEEWLKKIEEKSPEARECLRQRPSEQWSRACFSTRAQCDMILNNLCECFNKYILDARDKGIITMYEMIKVKLMKRIQSKADIMRRCNTTWCTKILKKLQVNKEWARHYKATFSGGSVQLNGLGKQHVVDLKKRECSCRRWQLSGIPCCHACAAIFGNNDNPENYLAECYSVETYLKVYSFIIEPTRGMGQWPQVLNPPASTEPPSPKRTKRGRKVKARRKEAEEIEDSKRKGKRLRRKGNIVITCKICKRDGHNRKTCTSQPTPSSSQPATRARKTTTTPSTSSKAQPAKKSRQTITPSISSRASSPIIGVETTVRWMMDGSSHSNARPIQPQANQRSTGFDSNVTADTQPRSQHPQGTSTNVRPQHLPRRPFAKSSNANAQKPWR